MSPTLGVYISVPFCRSKCTYCNFASGVFSDDYHHRYVDRILAGIRQSHSRASSVGATLPRAVDSVYLGGGTPSILDPALLDRLFVALRQEFDLLDGAEVTLECAPGQLSEAFLERMLLCGVNRVSFGVQSFIDREAAVVGRFHSCEAALEDIYRVQQAGISSVNADLIAGLPYQTAASWRVSLAALVDSGVDHASIYMLEVDEDSRLGRELLDQGGRYHAAAVPSDDQVADLFTEAVTTLGLAGLEQYEISNFARPGAESLHNQKYWLRQPYVGFGLDAHSMLRTADGDALRFHETDDLQSFLNRPSGAEIESDSAENALEEAWFLGLRMNKGVSFRHLEDEFGYEMAHRSDPIIDDLERDNLLQRAADRVFLTSRGRLLSNEVFARFLGESSTQPELIHVL